MIVFSVIGIVAVVVVIFFVGGLAGMVLGVYLASEDASARLTGKKPVDDFWRKRGMR